jgi:hypothetical protein
MGVSQARASIVIALTTPQPTPFIPTKKRERPLMFQGVAAGQAVVFTEA